MRHRNTATDLHKTRLTIAEKVRGLRQGRQWTQAELGKRLGLSQARLSQIERGSGSFTAEQLVAIIATFNVSLADFLPPTDREDELQNALIQHGARHLRQVPGVASTGRFVEGPDAILAVLLDPRSARLVTALAPVLVEHIDDLVLPALRARLDASARSARLGWLIENVRDALLRSPQDEKGAWRRKASRAVAVLSNELDHFQPPVSAATPLDIFDTSIRSARSRDLVWKHASEVSRRWGVATDIQIDDFEDALWQVHGSA